MTISASRLRENIYNILDEVAETGVPVKVIRKGKVIRIEAEQKPSKLGRLRKRPYALKDAESIVQMDWLNEWSELK